MERTLTRELENAVGQRLDSGVRCKAVPGSAPCRSPRLGRESERQRGRDRSGEAAQPWRGRGRAPSRCWCAGIGAPRTALRKKLLLYFQSPKRSGGGECELRWEAGRLLVCFAQPDGEPGRGEGGGAGKCWFGEV